MPLDPKQGSWPRAYNQQEPNLTDLCTSSNPHQYHRMVAVGILRKLCEFLAFSPHRGYQQQDAHEFMRYLLDKLHSELLQTLTPPAPSKPPPSTSVATLSTTSTASTPSHAQAHHTVVSDIFGGVLQSDVSTSLLRRPQAKSRLVG